MPNRLVVMGKSRVEQREPEPIVTHLKSGTFTRGILCGQNLFHLVVDNYDVFSDAVLSFLANDRAHLTIVICDYRRAHCVLGWRELNPRQSNYDYLDHLRLATERLQTLRRDVGARQDRLLLLSVPLMPIELWLFTSQDANARRSSLTVVPLLPGMDTHEERPHFLVENDENVNAVYEDNLAVLETQRGRSRPIVASKSYLRLLYLKYCVHKYFVDLRKSMPARSLIEYLCDQLGR